jgi:hypothetical protein
MNFASGKEAGTTFEKLFERQCQLAGLWAEPNHIKARRGWKGKLQELKSNLDYTVIRRGGTLAFIDCKTYDDWFFTFSKLDPHQVELARRYNEYGIDAGFVVWFREVDKVSFFSGHRIAALGERTRFSFGDGIALGTWARFDPTLVFRLQSNSMSVKR